VNTRSEEDCNAVRRPNLSATELAITAVESPPKRNADETTPNS
jgi:hypothetical protein